MQEIITVGVPGEDCAAKKRAIELAAKSEGMSLSRFMLWLYEQYAGKKAKQAARLKADVAR